jgi:hypothetical protein
VRTILLAGLILTMAPFLRGAPPFSGTIFIDPDIINESDPTTYQDLTDAGRGNRLMFDRRVNAFITLNAFLFKARYTDGRQIEIQVNPEFETQSAARIEAAKYAPVIGQLPACLREDVKTVWIHRGDQPFGGGNNNLLIHTGQAATYAASGILEETLVHEASHTSLDADHAESPGWLAAQAADPEYISTYARDNPTREDIAESFLPYLAVRYRANRISTALANSITAAIPNRLAYFDALDLDLNPLVPPAPLVITRFEFDVGSGRVDLTWDSRPGRSYEVDMGTELGQWQLFSSNLPSLGATTHLELTHPLPENQAFFRVRELPSH